MLIELARTPIAAVIRTLAVERKSGDLQVRSGKLVRTAFFDGGRLVFAASNLKKDRLGEALVALGRITDEDYTRVTALMKGDRKRRFGEALVAAGVMDKNEIGTSVVRQVRRIVLSLFELTEGAASFEERRCSIPLEYMVSVSVSRVLYDGIRSMKSPEMLQEALGPLDRGVVLAGVPPFRFDPKDCTAEEREILELARRRVTVRRLAWAAGGLSFSRLRATYALWSAGIIQDADVLNPPQPVTQMETGTFLLSALQRQKDPSAEQAIRLEVQDELERSARLDNETWLRVARSAPRTELVKALEEKMERYHALREAVSEDEQIKTDIEVILGRASAMLRLAKQAPPPPGAAPVRPTPRAGSPRVPPPPAPTPLAPAIELELEAPAPPPAEPPRAAALIGPEDSAAGPGSSSFEGTARIEHLLMEGEVRMTVSDYANAIKVYDKLVELAPKIAAYRMRLAVAMACYPRTAKQAEREFVEALRLDPDNAEYHYQFGLYFKAMKVKSRAVAEMRAAVRLNSRHQNAREELASLSPKDSALTTLRKLFG